MKSIEAFKKYYQQEKQQVDYAIQDNAKQWIDEQAIISEKLHDFQELNSEGKRIRGVLVNLGYQLLGKKDHYSNALALAYEVFQTAILVHDDIIDKDLTRRGKDTIPYATYKKYKNNSDNEKELMELGNSIGICVGDYGLYQANKIIIDAYQKDPNFSKVISYFHDTVLNTIRGELLDVVLPFQSKYQMISPNMLEESIQNIYRLKTAHYTIIGPLAVGLLLGGGTEEQVKDITKFGEKIGIAFQIQDDILGIYSDETGKVKGSDIKEFKQTILYSHVCKTKYHEELLKYYGKDDLTEESIQQVQELLEKSGSKQYAIDCMNHYYEEGLNVMKGLSWIKDSEKDLLIGFVEYLKMRNK